MKVVVTRSARLDLEEIGDHIAKDIPKRAASFVRELRVAALILGEAPRAFPLVPGYETAGIRRRAFGNYLIFYRIEARQIALLHVIHGARDYGPAIFPNDEGRAPR